MNPYPSKKTKELLSEHEIQLKKSLGQNFLTNPTIAPQIADASGVSDQMGVLEIGPGAGALTKELSIRAKKVVALEIDKRLAPILRELQESYPNVSVLWEDVMEANLPKILENEFPDMDVVVCANLPYYITTPILMRFLEEKIQVKSITIMIQKEAAERICAPPGVRISGAISASVWYYATPQILFQVNRNAFFPAPDVDSTVIQLEIRETPPFILSDPSLYFKIVKAAFSQRRKTILNTLSSGLSVSKENINDILESVNLMPNLRAENLSLEDFGKLTEAFYMFLQKKELIHYELDKSYSKKIR